MNDLDAGQLALLILLTVGVVARLTRLVTKDSITDPARKWIEAKMVKAGQRGLWNKIDELVNCPWCVSIWVGVPSGVIMIWHSSNRFVIAGALGLTASWLAANVQVREPKAAERIIIVEDDEKNSSET